MGTELLLGQIANTNAQKISEQLAGAGVDVHFHTAVGDNPGRMVTAFRTALDRADVVIVTGGLGPTPDDITREAVAEVMGVALERDPVLVDQIRAVFERLNRPMPDDNLRQADLPQGATPIPPEGTAPGFFVEMGEGLLVALPGVPWEMRAMLTKAVLPMLRARAGDATIVSREVLVIGLGESHTHEKIADLVEGQTNPTIAYLAGRGQVRVRLTAKAQDEAAALGLIRPVEAEIRDRLGTHAVEGNGDLLESFGQMLRERGLTVAVAESLTGGAIGSQLTSAGGSSDFFKGGIVSYWTEAKRDVLGVDESILLGPGAVSEEAAMAMAEAAAMKFASDVGLSATGVAGPSEQEGNPVGTIWVGATFGGKTEARRVRGYGDRDNIRQIAVTAAIDLGRRLILATES